MIIVICYCVFGVVQFVVVWFIWCQFGYICVCGFFVDQSSDFFCFGLFVIEVNWCDVVDWCGQLNQGDVIGGGEEGVDGVWVV